MNHMTRLVVLMSLWFLITVACGQSNSGEPYVESTCKDETISLVQSSTLQWSYKFSGSVARVFTSSTTVTAIIRSVDASVVTTSITSPQITEQLLVLDLTNGAIKWQYPSDGQSGVPNVIRGVSVSAKYVAIFYQIPEPKVIVFSSGTGQVVFEAKMDVFEVLLAEDRLFLRDGARVLRVYDLNSSGLIAKHLPSTGRGERGLFYDGTGTVYSLYDGNVYVYDARTGDLIRDFAVAFAAGTGFLFDGAFTADQHLLGAVGNEVVYVDLVTGYRRWHSLLSTPSGHALNVVSELWPPGIVVDNAYIVADDHKFYEIYLPNGLVSPLPMPPQGEVKTVSPPIVRGEHLYAVFDDQMLKSFDLGSRKWIDLIQTDALRSPDFESGSTLFAPVVVMQGNDSLLVAFGCQTLYAIHVSE